MPDKENLLKKFLQRLNRQHVGSGFNYSRHILLGLSAFIVLAFLFGILIYERYQILKQTQKKEASVAAENAKEKIQETLEHSFSATRILTFFIDDSGTVKNFDSVAAEILSADKDIDALELVPGGVIKNIYPLKGNEMVIGYNILKDPLRSKEAFKAIEKKKFVFSGPFGLKQGGFGIVGRLPVFRNEKFWGFSAAVIKMSTLLKATGINRTGEDGYYYQLSKINPDTKKEEFFIPHVKAPLKNYLYAVDIPVGDWKLSVEPVIVNKGIGEIYILVLIAFLCSALGAFFVFNIVRRPEKLDRLVRERTRELKDSENKYRSLIDRVSDAFVSLDKDWNYTYVNKKAGEIFNRKPESLLGKNIWVEFPEGIDKPFYHAYYTAMQTQQYQYVEEFYYPYEKWFENHIYPSKEGLTIFFKDITEIKKVSLTLQENEEKYRSLIEQASDGIVITDLDGYILEVNNSMALMSGYSIEEMLGNSLYKFLPANDVALHPLRLKELMAGESLLYQRKLLKKDGSVIEIEVNSKMASTQTLIGFIRDISERKKTEEAIRYQARLLQSVSDAITSLDVNRCIVSWNTACEELYGFTADEAIGKRVVELVTFEYPGTTNEEVFKQVSTKGYWKGEFNFNHPKTKEKIYLLSNINLFKNQLGEVSGFIITCKNIGDWKKAEEEISKSNERFELIAQATNDAIWDHDFIKNETWGNKNLYNIYGLEYGKEKIDLEMFFSRIHPEQRNVMKQRMAKALGQKENSIAEEFSFKTANGEYKNFYDRAYIKYDETGKPLRILGAMEDITGRVMAKQQILKEKELSDSIINSLPGIFYLYNKEGKFLRWNKNFETVTGYSNTAIQKMHPLDFFDIKDQALLIAKITKVFAEGSDEVEADFLLKNKEKIPYFLTGQAIIYEGEICLMGVGLDFSEREIAQQQLKENEERLRLSLEAAKQGLYDVNVQTGAAIVNEQYALMLGYDPATFVETNSYWLERLHPDDFPKTEKAYKDYIEGITEKYEIEFRQKTKDNQWKWILSMGKIVEHDADGKPLRMLGTHTDITDRKKAEEELYQSEQKYRLLFYNNPLPMWMTTIPGLDIIDVNESAIKHYGYTREEFLKLNAKDLRPAEDVEHFVNEVAKMRPGTNNTRAWRHKKKDGTIIQVEIYSHEIFYEGQRVWLGLSHDVTDKYLAKELLQKSYEDIRQLASNLQGIREEERTNIAREIHDELGQQLTGLKMDLHWLTRKIKSKDEEVISKMNESMELINATITSVRKIATDLRPSILDDLGLLAALEWQGEEFEKRSGTKVKFINAAGDLKVKPEVTTALFRIYQELLTNIARHANASLVTANLFIENNTLYFSIQDNGIGFNTETIGGKKTLGLLGIKERTLLIGGIYEIKTQPGNGSETVISIPLNIVNITV